MFTAVARGPCYPTRKNGLDGALVWLVVQIASYLVVPAAAGPSAAKMPAPQRPRSMIHQL